VAHFKHPVIPDPLEFHRQTCLSRDAVALLGDLQYQVGRYSDFENSYDLTYGAFKMISRPAPGNHDFYDEHGETGVAGYGFFSYFNGFLIDTNAIPLREKSRRGIFS
jgi:hypothetical protein